FSFFLSFFLSFFFFFFNRVLLLLPRLECNGNHNSPSGPPSVPYPHRWVFLYEKGYQTSSGLISSVSVKLKGLAVTQLPGLGPQVWDVADYVFPAQGDNSFVVMTNFIVTPKQTQGYCAEAPRGFSLAPGIRTGKCVAFNDTLKTCEIFGWCPVEVDDDIPRPALLREAENFTLFIKNSISFPRFKVNRRNLVEEVNAAYMKTCLYHKTLHPLCPVFQLGYVVQESGQNFSTLAEKVWGMVPGGWGGLVPCITLLPPDPSPRFARHFVENGTDHRHLFKVFGIRFDILVDGKAGKFDIIPTMTTIGSGIGIFGVATVLCDLLLLHILPKRHYYKQKKFKYAEDMGPGAGERDLAATSSTLGLQENMRTS
uniref:P2X purinoceptor n=1 Tax=Colobus angolensis palliatus TaxID=336983 RepID=A0A2K5HZT7_COLAP